MAAIIGFRLRCLPSEQTHLQIALRVLVRLEQQIPPRVRTDAPNAQLVTQRISNSDYRAFRYAPMRVRD